MLAALIALLAPQVIAPTTSGAITIDAFFDDWVDRPQWIANRPVRGDYDGPRDLSARVQLGFDTARLFLAAQVVDDKFVPGGANSGDRLYFVFAPEGQPKHTVQVVLNTLELRPPTVQIDGKPCAACEAAGTLRRDGWAVEAMVPLAQVPVHQVGPVPFVGVLHDVDTAGGPATVIASGPVDDDLNPTMPTAHLDVGAALNEMRLLYSTERGGAPPLQTLREDCFGDARPEEVLITPDDIVILGADLPERAAYMYFTHGWRGGAKLLRADLMELDGRPGKELLVEHSEWSVPDEVQVDIVEIYGLRDGYLMRMFAQKLAERFIARQAEAVTRLEVVEKRDKQGARRLRVPVATVRNLDAASYYAPDPPGAIEASSPPLPWNRRKPLQFSLRENRWQSE